MIRERRGQRSKLMAERKKLAGKLEALDRQIESMDGEENGSGGEYTAGGRPRNDKPLPDVIADVLKGNKAMKVGDIVDGVFATGYRSSSANFRGIVNQALIKDSRFKSESRGQYKLAK
jgi:hypothetical protein